jgi:exodeoxyribonuclease VII large subunit
MEELKFNHTGSGPAERAVLSVSSLNRMARSLLEDNFPSILVEGEISNFATPSSGHWYLTLKDRSSQIKCAMFLNRNRAVGFKPSDGNQILVKGRLSIYEGRGDFQLIIDSMEEAGDGLLRRAFEELKIRLHQEGLFEANHKQEIYSHYSHIGIITSPTGAVVHDILSVLQRRFPATKLTLLPVMVQGPAAAGEITHAIELANKHKAKLGLEALIIGRGGGSLEDLQAFNEEQVARAIYNSALPVVSAVGHEVDITIADYVADLRAPTPSAAAEQMSPNQQDYQDLCFSLHQQLLNLTRQRLHNSDQKLNWLHKQLKHPGRRLQEHAQDLDRFEERIRRAAQQQINSQKTVLQQLVRSLLANSPMQKLGQIRLQQANDIHRLRVSLQHIHKQKHTQLMQLSRSLSAISPLNTLARGYSITYGENSSVIKSSAEVKVGSKISSRLGKGSIHSTVNSITSEDS